MSKRECKVGAPVGNKNGTKLKDLDIRQLAYTQYCAHLAKGKSKQSWCFEHPEFRCTWETMEKYLNDEVEFDPLHKKIAETKGFAYWEEVVEDSATGKNKDANTASLQMLMRNKYSWDKQSGKEVCINHDYNTQFDTLMEQLKRAQDMSSINFKGSNSNIDQVIFKVESISFIHSDKASLLQLIIAKVKPLPS